jgi:hypothetical protein
MPGHFALASAGLRSAGQAPSPQSSASTKPLLKPGLLGPARLVRVQDNGLFDLSGELILQGCCAACGLVHGLIDQRG